MNTVLTLVARATVLAAGLAIGWAGSDVLLFPQTARLLSSSPPYAWFHLVVAAVALGCVLLAQGRGAPWFAFLFGLVDLYQAVAAGPGWFPAAEFQWTANDTQAHWILGGVLTVVGGITLLRKKKQ